MSTASTPSPALHRRTAPIALPGSDPTSAADRAMVPLIEVSRIGADDRVKVIGHNVLTHLLALVRAGCRSATAITPHFPVGRADAVDVVWIVGVSDVEREVAPVLRGAGAARLVAIELRDDTLVDGLRHLLHRFGLRTAHHAVDAGTGACIITARRPTWRYDAA
ncbi:MAG: hypothetical protein P4M00_24845 [Azospirillaceae bacterium]|nr:hypothetical protein [Azospirillaceae bacterium]